MIATVRPSIFRHLLYGLILVSAVVTGLVLLANHAARNATRSLEAVVVDQVTPLASAQRLQSRIDTLRGQELELHQLKDIFAVPPQLERMREDMVTIGLEIVRLQEALADDRPSEAQRLGEHWEIYRESVRREVELARQMDMAGVAGISSTRSRGAHDAISAILRDVIDDAERAVNAAYTQARAEAGRQQTLIAFVLPAGLLLLFTGLVLFGRSVSRRISRLRDAAHAVAHGTEIQKIPVSGGDELTELAQAFNTMQQKVLAREAELRSAQDRLKHRAKAAEAATLAKSQFLANMSHEIRTPMNGVLGMLEILRETPMSPDQADYVVTAHESATALLELLNDILDLSKIEAGKVRLEKVEFDLEQLVDDVVAVHADRAFTKGLRIGTTIDATLPVHLLGDPGRLRQVLNNLLSNAVKFTEQGSIAVAVSPASTRDGEALLHFEVSDTGIGIEAANRERIFDAFTQADGSTTRRFGGTGLGLTICSQLVQAMDGRLGVDSAPGEGSAFWFTLPLREVSEDDRPAPLPGIAGAHVLVVDPEPRQRDYLVRRLTGWGCKVIAVTEAGGAEDAARAAAGTVPFRLVLLADASPDATTAGLIATLRGLTPGLPVALIAPQGRMCRDETVTELGIDICLTRPLRKSQLQKALLQLLRGIPGTEDAATPPASDYPLHVLIAEDNPINQKVAVSMLQKLGCTTQVAGNGREALEQLQRHAYDLVLMDCQMPEMDGMEATTAIRALHGSMARTPIAAMTAHAMASDRDRCLAVGMDDYLTKPLSLEQLRRVLERFRPRDTEATPPARRAAPSG